MIDTFFGAIGAVGVVLTIYFYFRGDKDSGVNKKTTLRNLDIVESMDRIYAGKDLDIRTEEAIEAIRETSNWEVYKYAKRDPRISLSVIIGCFLLFVGSFTALAIVSSWASTDQDLGERLLPLMQLLTCLTAVFETLWLLLLCVADGLAKRTFEKWQALTQNRNKPTDVGKLSSAIKRSRSIQTLAVVALSLTTLHILGLFQELSSCIDVGLILCLIVIMVKATGINRSWNGGLLRAFADWYGPRNGTTGAPEEGEADR